MSDGFTEQRVRTLETDMAQLKERLAPVERGVANFRDFQLKNIEFMGWFKANQERREEKEREERETREKKEKEEKQIREKKEKEEKEAREKVDKRRARIHYWWLGILSGVILLAIGTAFACLGHFLETHHISKNSPTISQSQPMRDAQLPNVR